jgi:hypothetical protein
MINLVFNPTLKIHVPGRQRRQRSSISDQTAEVGGRHASSRVPRRSRQALLGLS